MDRKKYIVEASDDVKKVMAMGVTHGGAIWTDTTDIENLEELNSDYIDEHYGSLQDDAYQRGLEKGKQTAIGAAELREKLEYQRGLNDAWKCARELCLNGACKDWFGEYFNTFIKNHTAQDAIEKLKAHKQDDKIEVGDEVNWLGDCFIVTRIFQPRNMKEQCDGIDDDGCVYSNVLIDDLEKTGRHFDIESILEAMKA